MRYASLSICLVIMLSGCGGSDSSSDKDLFSLWTATDSSLVLDLTNGDFSTPTDFFFDMGNGALCGCTLTAFGSQASGTYTFNSCTYEIGSSSRGDPGCNALNHTGTYTKSGNVLTTYDSFGEATFR
ncbi:MAG: hypothetical protein KUG82_11545 [Pseudomonadales bacterium]|nr:hypothetical protein [Pseudomonadales bacterium]